MKGPEIGRDQVVEMLDARFIRVFDLRYAPGKHYYDATRRSADDLVAVRTDEEFRSMLPDAVTCFVVLRTPGSEPRLLLQYEYRYPVGRFLLSPPAGLLDRSDALDPEPVVRAAIREIREETGIDAEQNGTVRVIEPLAFSTPGMTDECNAIAGVVCDLKDLSCMNQDGAEGTECFDGFQLVTKEEAKALLKSGRDEKGFFYSIYTWGALMWFVSGMWEQE